jgi:hypothetical protein
MPSGGAIGVDPEPGGMAPPEPGERRLTGHP